MLKNRVPPTLATSRASILARITHSAVRRLFGLLTREIRYLSPCWHRVINLIPHVRRSHRWHFPAEA
ncbi:MAG: hypothetical protein WCC93_09550, partial [Chthoniobacterales bacterium]